MNILQLTSSLISINGNGFKTALENLKRLARRNREKSMKKGFVNIREKRAACWVLDIHEFLSD